MIKLTYCVRNNLAPTTKIQTLGAGEWLSLFGGILGFGGSDIKAGKKHNVIIKCTEVQMEKAVWTI